MNRRWTEQEIWDWYNARPWINGCNFNPSNATNVEFWQKYNHEAVFARVEEEVKLAASIGLNSFRMHLPHRTVWEQEHDTCMEYWEEFLQMADKYGITVMPVFFGDCLMPKGAQRPAPVLGPQEEAKPGFFGGSSASPFDGTDEMGWMPEDDPANWPAAEAYVMEFVNKYRDDPRIIIWNIWNEAGNSHRNKDKVSLPFIKRLFDLLREADVTQPLTCDVWGCYEQTPDGRYNWIADLDPMEKEMIDLSDIVTWHYYGDLLHTKKYMKMLEQFNRPLINDEWLHRPWGSFIQTTLPLFKKYHVGSYFFGFVNGKHNFHIPWNFIRNDKRIDCTLWMHDIFHNDFTPYDQDEIDTFLELKDR